MNKANRLGGNHNSHMNPHMNPHMKELCTQLSLLIGLVY